MTKYLSYKNTVLPKKKKEKYANNKNRKSDETNYPQEKYLVSPNNSVDVV